MENSIQCPKCGSTHYSANQKGFSSGKAIVGDVVFDPLGLLAGNMGKNKIIITCLSCGNQYKPGEGKYEAPRVYTPDQKKSIIIGYAVFGGIAIILYLYLHFSR